MMNRKLKKKTERCKDSTTERIEEVGRDGKDQDNGPLILLQLNDTVTQIAC
jgi:hypothetical protein